MSIAPFIRTPFSDLTGGLIDHQGLGRCGKQEALYMDCLEAYGLDRGRVVCKKYFGNYHECQTLTKQYKRFKAMARERQRQINAGTLKGDKQYVTPVIDSY